MIPKAADLSAAQLNRVALSRALTTDYRVPCPAGLTVLPFQRAGVEYARKTANGHCLFGDEPGVGKTIQAISYANDTGAEHMLVIAPSAVLYNWVREVKTWWTGTREVDVEVFNPKSFNPKRPPQVLVVSYYWATKLEAVKLIKSGGPYHIAVVDEAHYLKNPLAVRTQYVLAKNGLISVADVRLALTGTAIENRPMELFPLIKALCPRAIGGMDQFGFGMTFCNGQKKYIGRDRMAWDFTGASKMKELGMLLRGNFMVRRKKALVLPQLPPKFEPALVYIDALPGAKAIVKRLELFTEDVVSGRLKEAEFETMSADFKALGILKAPAAAAYYQEQLEAGHTKLVIFAHHTEVLNILEKALVKYYPLKILGGMGAKKKDDIVRLFQQDPIYRLILISITAASVGITLTAGSYVSFTEFSWKPGENEQCVDRTHRIGQTKGVQTEYLVIEKSLEERRLRYLLQKQKVITEVLD